MAKCGMNLFYFHHSSLLKGAKNAARVSILRNGIKKNASISSFFNGQRWTKCTMNISAAFQIDGIIDDRKIGGHSHALKGSHSMGDGRIFLKSRRDAFFNKDLSNEPNFNRNHLAGQWTVPLKNIFLT
jgi:hypothetical protein